jgi:F-type H+-transporting ATPase subunit gamma
MESGQSLQRRMRSVKNIGQITKAMELVAATKMRRAQELALNSRPYAYTALEMLGILSNLKDVPMPELLEQRPVEKTAFMLVTSDKGLAGSFNGSVIRKFEKYVRENNIDITDEKYVFIAIGQKARTYLERRGVVVNDAFTRVGDFTTIQEVNPISNLLIAGYLKHDFDQVISFSTVFVTALRQEVFIRELLPISFEKVRESVEQLVPEAGRYAHYLDISIFSDEDEREFLIEPSAKEVLEQLAPELLKIRIYSMVLEANASEHSARRVAMKNASDNARDLSEELNVIYNKTRQAAITSQIIEVTSGAQALQQ